MRGFLTICYCDWTKKYFSRGVMRIIGNKRTNQPIYRSIKSDEKEEKDYYIKTDPDFSNFTYSRCHKKLRQQIQPGDILFFRTLWQRKQYFIGYFLIKEKTGSSENPICVADKNSSLFVPDFRIKITPEIVKKLSPRAVFKKSRHINSQINENLGRNYLCLDSQKVAYLVNLIQKVIKK